MTALEPRYDSAVSFFPMAAATATVPAPPDDVVEKTDRPLVWPTLMAFANGPGAALVAEAAQDLIRTVQVDLHINRVCAGIQRTGERVTYFSLHRYLHGLLKLAWEHAWIPKEIASALAFAPAANELTDSREAAERTDWVALRLTAICRLATDPKAMPSPVAPHNLLDLCLEP